METFSALHPQKKIFYKGNMRMIGKSSRMILLGIGVSGLSSCGMIAAIGSTAGGSVANLFRGGDDIPKASEQQSAGSFSPKGPGGLKGAKNTPAVVHGDVKNMPSEEGLVFSDPLAPESSAENIEALLKQEKQEEWYDSYEKAGRMARRQNLPILIWFTETGVSQNCAFLKEQVFDDAKFRDWAKENLVCLKMDFTIQDIDESRKIHKEHYVEKMRKKYGVRTNPTLVFLTPDMQIVQTVKGYRNGNDKFALAQIKKVAGEASQDWESTKNRLLKNGYRYWQGKNDVKVIAKLIRYADGDIWLAEPDGSTLKTNESQLIKEDQDWIQSEKARRMR